MRITRARLCRRECRTSNAAVETLCWTLLGCRHVAIPWFSPANALPGFSGWNLSLLGTDGDRLNIRERDGFSSLISRTGEIKSSSKEEAMLKGESNGKILQLTKAMMKGDSTTGASKLIAYRVATTSVLHPNGIRGEDTGRHGWGPVAFDIDVAGQGTSRNMQKTNALMDMWRAISNTQFDVRIGRGR
jgi:hypothetical protein